MRIGGRGGEAERGIRVCYERRFKAERRSKGG
jgi:hypothetical protein